MGPVVFKKPFTTPDLVGTEARLKCGCHWPQSFNLPTYDNAHFCEKILLHSSFAIKMASVSDLQNITLIIKLILFINGQ